MSWLRPSLSVGLRRPSSTLVTGLALMMIISGCGVLGGSPPEKSPQEALAAAASAFDSTTGMKIQLSTPQLPEGIAAVREAKGVVTRAPAFKGEMGARLGSQERLVPVVSVDRKVYAKLSPTTPWAIVDPVKYNGFDPAGFLTQDSGLAVVLRSVTDLTKGATRTGGVDNLERLTEYLGTVPGSAMKHVIPSASADTSFATKLAITDTGQLREATFTGVFYPKTQPITYTLIINDYGRTDLITPPV